MEHIDRYLATLEKSFGKPRPKVKTMMLEIEFTVNDVSEMVRIIAKSMFPHGIPRILVGRVKSGGPRKAAAWLQVSGQVPRYGTRAFEMTRVQLYVRNSLIEDAPFQTVAFAIAHELSHLILYSIGKTNHDEKYVDLLAMHFGFAELYVQGKKFYAHVKGENGHFDWDGSVENLLQLSEVSAVGYLSDAETEYACKMIAQRR